VPESAAYQTSRLQRESRVADIGLAKALFSAEQQSNKHLSERSVFRGFPSLSAISKSPQKFVNNYYY
jgi:hypothetical protein